MPQSKYEVTLDDGTHLCYINPALAEKQEIDDATLEHIRELHKINAMHCAALRLLRKEHMPVWNSIWTDIQFALQEAWGFPLSVDAHKFWDIPGCCCPRIDNADNWPTGPYYVAGNCPVHGYLLDRS